MVILNPSSPAIFISNSLKIYNLLTLVDQLDFIYKRKRKLISVTKKKILKKIFTVVESELFIQENHCQWARKGGEVEARSH